MKATAPPLTDTALSIPLGFPWRTFSAKNAYPSMMSVSVDENRSYDGREMMPCARSSDEATQVEKAADEPRPAPIGRLAEAVNVTPGLRLSGGLTRHERRHKPAYEFLSLPLMSMYRYRNATVAPISRLDR